MMYLIRSTCGKHKAHIWTGTDSYCSMYTTGGLNKKKYKVAHDKKDYPLCTMCVNVFKRYEELSEDESEHIKSILTEK